MIWGGVIKRFLTFNACQASNNYFSCTVEGLSYVATSKDTMVIRRMFLDGVNHAANNMKRFQALTKQYYNVDDNAGYFLDLGANIGTTGIYFTSKLAPNLKLLSFEPDTENFKMHRINLMLNDMESKTTLVKCGLGNKADEMTLYKDLKNPGHNNFTERRTGFPTETVKVITLDSYFAENKIAASEVKYIWIDVEGFEPQLLLGAQNLIRENPAPIFVECNLIAWDKSGLFEDMMALLSEGYSHFILFGGGKETLYPLEELKTMKRPNREFGHGWDIFLIRKGAIA